MRESIQRSRTASRGHLEVARVARLTLDVDNSSSSMVMVVAYAYLFRSSAGDSPDGHALARRAVDLAFMGLTRADELLNDAALGIAEWATVRGLLTPAQLRAATRPLPIDAPRRPPSDTVMERRFGTRRGVASDYSSIWMSRRCRGALLLDTKLKAPCITSLATQSECPICRRPEPRPRRPTRPSKRLGALVAGMSLEDLRKLATLAASHKVPASGAKPRRHRTPYYPSEVAQRSGNDAVGASWLEADVIR